MKPALLCCSMILTAGIAAAQTPLISSVVNAASGITAGLPNSGIAQGAIFLIVGSNLGPGTISIAQSAFQNTTLSGTSVSVTVNGTTVAALMYYTSASQVSALLPSNTPAGTGTVTVTYNGQASGKAAITVVPNNLGIFTVTSDGQGVGIVTYADYSLVSAAKAANCGGPSTTCGAANPGDTLILWATGLGPVGGSDASGAGLGVPMPNIPLKLWLGGLQATVIYQGRSGCCIGEDQIVFVVPAGVPTGCAVPLAVQINNQISNYTVMPVASSGRTCTPSEPYLSNLLLQQLVSGAPLTFSHIKLNRRPDNNGPGSHDNGDAQFSKISVPPQLQPFIASLIDSQPAGTCIVVNSFNLSNLPLTFLGAPDAGPSLTVNGPNGSRTLSKTGGPGPTDYFTQLGPGNYLSPGTYTITGPGGADIGSFAATIAIPQPPVWTNPASLATVNRANGLTGSWTGGSATPLVWIFGASATDASFNRGAVFFCAAAGAAGTLTVPPSVLLALPAGPNGFITFEPSALSTTFTANGLNLGFVTSNADTSILTTFQ